MTTQLQLINIIIIIIYICSRVRQAGRQSDKPCDVTAQHSSVMYSTSNPMYNFYMNARNFAVQINGFMSQVTLMLSTDINITESTYSCQFQYEFGNQ